MLQAMAPWADLASAAYCQWNIQDVSLKVECATVGGVQLPTTVDGFNVGLAGALPPSLGDLGPSLTDLGLSYNPITSVPAELTALTGLTFLDLSENQLTGLPTEFRTFSLVDSPLAQCYLFENDPGFSCANVGADTSCCTGNDVYNGNDCGEGLSGGPCYTG